MPTIFTDIVTYLAVAIVGAVLGIAINAVVQRKKLNAERSQTEEYVRHTRQGAEREAENVVKEAKLEAKDMLLQAKADVEREQKLKQGELAVHEKRVLQREEQLERKIAAVERRDAEAQRREALLAKREEAVAGTEATSERLLKERRQSLEQVPENAGPLNSGALVHRSIGLMRELSPGYLQQFLSYIDALSWVEQINGSLSSSSETPRATSPRKRSKAKSRTP